MFKKISAGVIACLMLGALAANVNATPSTKTMTIPGVANGSINVTDTVADAGYADGAVMNIDIHQFHHYGAHPANATGKAWVVYDAEYVYAYVEITDAAIDYSNADTSAVWERDSVGIMLDFDYNRAPDTKYGDNPNNKVGYLNLSGDGHYVSYHIYNGDARPEYASTAEKVTYSSIANDNGVIKYEFALPFPPEFNAVEGAKFGFEIMINNAEDGARAGTTCWSEDGNNMWRYSDCIGTATLGAAYVEPEEPSDDPTDEPTDEPSDEPTDTPVTADAGFVAAAALMAVAAG
ncbi:MAG: hypothetical protein J6S76_07535, partial [Clostridia bacterium]|nr:hypothetical protein [Clostridia bacterium]